PGDHGWRLARPRGSLGLLAKQVLARLALLSRCERRRGGAALLLLVVLGLRLLLFLVASHLTFRHGALRLVAALVWCPILHQLPWTTRWSLSFFTTPDSRAVATAVSTVQTCPHLWQGPLVARRIRAGTEETRA